jgi:hypothetical protein
MPTMHLLVAVSLPLHFHAVLPYSPFIRGQRVDWRLTMPSGYPPTRSTGKCLHSTGHSTIVLLLLPCESVSVAGQIRRIEYNQVREGLLTKRSSWYFFFVKVTRLEINHRSFGNSLQWRNKLQISVVDRQIFVDTHLCLQQNFGLLLSYNFW